MTQKMVSHFQNIAIFGAGLSGLAAYRRACDLGIGCVISDDQGSAPDAVTTSHWQDWHQWEWDKIDTLVLSPGVPHHHPAPHGVVSAAMAHNVAVISEVEFGLLTGQWGKMIVITGTNGKSTTTALTAHLLAQAGLDVRVGGNLGTPLCALDETTDGYTVLELSSYQLETTPSLAPAIAALLNITPDHLDRHGGMDGYIEAKKRALTAVPKSGLALMSYQSHIMSDIAAWAVGHLPCNVQKISADDLTEDEVQNPYLAGAHNRENASFAMAIARACGVSHATCLQGIKTFIGLDHRLQPVGDIGKIVFINDSKATNGDATAKALSAYEHIIWLAGGRAKADGLNACTPYFDHIHEAHFYGESADVFYEQAKAHMRCYSYETLDDAFLNATSSLPEEAVILLSPAAASFDQFDNFGSRGRHFQQLVTQYIATSSTSVNAGGQPC